MSGLEQNDDEYTSIVKVIECLIDGFLAAACLVLPFAYADTAA